MALARINDPMIWLAENGIRCERYRATLSPSACDTHQRWDPEACHKCRRAQSMRARAGWGGVRSRLAPVPGAGYASHE